MKTILMTLLVIAGIQAQAQYSLVECKAHMDGVFYQMNISQSSFIDRAGKHHASKNYEISYYGKSRNTYSALYSVTQTSKIKNGEAEILTKISDSSTWKDMPDQLYVNSDILLFIPTLYLEGLTGSQDDEYVAFPETHCKTIYNF